MKLTEKLDILMSQRNMNKNILSKETGIPYTTIDGFYKKGTNNIKLSTLQKISKYFNISLDTLADDEKTLDDEDLSNSKESYYINNETRELAEELFSRPDLKTLLDASRKASPEDLRFIKDIVERFKK